MKPIKPVEIPNGSFNFCKISMAALAWGSFIFKEISLLYILFAVLVLSGLFRVEKAPFVWLYTNTLDKIFPSKKVMLDENGLVFAHYFGALFTGICIITINFISATLGWVLVFVLGILKLSGACGYCSALKLYGCMSSDDCCKVSKSILRRK